MKYCSTCGNELIMKETRRDGSTPYCPVCKEYHFPHFNSAISSVIFNPTKDKVLLIQQDQKKDYILVAGYINKQENANEALRREIKEEVNLEIISYQYNDNIYFDKSNTLIHNFISIAKDEQFSLTDEVDHAQWFSIEKAPQVIKANSLAKTFLFKAYHKMDLSEKLFIYEKNRIYLNDENEQMIAEITFPLKEGAYDINRTFVSPLLRGKGMAGKLMACAFRYLQNEPYPIRPSCSYASKWCNDHSEYVHLIVK